jgi:hypothetical protein
MSDFPQVPSMIALCLMFYAHIANADSITLLTFDYPGQSETFLDDINGKDQIVGRYGSHLDTALFITNLKGTITANWSYPAGDSVVNTFGIDDTARVAASSFDSSTFH